MNARELKGRVLEAFEHEVAPRFDQIAPHPCAECDELARDLINKDPLDVPLDRLEYHCWDLPLLSSEAKRFFLPAWLFRSIEQPASDFTDALIMNLDSDHRQDGYSEGERAVILDYLRYISSVGDDLDENTIRSAEERWA